MAGFGEGGEGPTWGPGLVKVVRGLRGGVSMDPSGFISFLVSLILFSSSSGSLFAASEKTLGRVWLRVFLANARLAQGCFDG